jgi:putative ABC transport system permease protein
MKHAFIVNESFVRHMGWTQAIDKKLEFHGRGKVIGVVRDFNYRSLHNAVEPLILHYNVGGPDNEMLVKVSSLSDIDVLKDVWKKVSGGAPLYFSFLDSNYDKQYKQEHGVMTMFFLFSILVIILTCQGLFGLSSLITRQRIKEIGIRKVLGGNELSIIYVLLKDTLILLAISLVVAAPVAYFGIDRWLREFAYQTSIGVEIYLGAWVITVITTVATAYYHTHKGVNTNPAISLRHDS